MLEVYHFRVTALIVVAVALAAGLLALVGTKPAEAAFPGSNGAIVFTSDRTTGTGVDNPEGDLEIFVMNKDGTGVAQLTKNTTDDFGPVFSADGCWIAYSSWDNADYEIYRRSYCSVFTFVSQLTNNASHDFNPAFSRDGSKIAFYSFQNSSSDIYVMDTDSSTNDAPVNLTNSAASDYTPVWSPDGTKIAFAIDTGGSTGPDEIFVMDTDPSTSDATNLTNDPADDSNPDFSPDGSKIAFHSYRNNNGDIYVMNATDGSALKRLTRNAAQDVSPAWSPDGSKIAFASYRGGTGFDSDVFTMRSRPEGRKNRPKNLTKTDAVTNGVPDWEPIPQP